MPPETTPGSSELQSPVEQKKPSAMNVPAAIIAGAVIIALAIVFTLGGPKTDTKTAVQQQQQNNQQPTSVPANVATLRPSDYIRGDKNADVLIIEYSDSDCPFCEKFHPELQKAVNDYNGKVAWVYRFFPLTSLHPNAYTEALALSCVGDLGGNDAFWKYLDTVINVTLSPDPKSNEALTTFAQQYGIDPATFKTCLKNDKSTAKIDADTSEAKSIGARGTPFSVAVNQKTGKQAVIPGYVAVEDLSKIIDQVLK